MGAKLLFNKFPSLFPSNLSESNKHFRVCLLIVGGGLFAVYADAFTGVGVFFFRDFALFGYPVAHYHRESFWRGEIPLWNPLSHCGMPFLAQWNTMVLYPGSLIYLLLPLPWSLTWFCLLHLILAGAGMFRLSETLGLRGAAAVVAGVIYSLNGLSQYALMWPNNIAAIGWAPWVIRQAIRGTQNGGRSLLWLVAIGSCQMLTGAPELILMTWIVAAVLCFTNTVSLPKTLLRLAVASLFITAICAAQLLPFIELVRDSHRSSSYGGTAWSMPATGFANLLVPSFYCNLELFGVPHQLKQQWTGSYYVGATSVLLILIGWKLCLARYRALLILAVFGLVLALGENGLIFPLLQKLVPAVGFLRFPIKAVFLFTLAAPLLAAAGARTVLEQQENGQQRSPIVLLGSSLVLVIIGLVWFAHTYRIDPASDDNSLVTGLTRLPFIIALGFAALWSFRSRRPVIRWAIPILIAGDLFTHSPRLAPTVAPGLFGPQFASRSDIARTRFSRASHTPAAEDRFLNAPLTNASAFIIASRLGLFANMNLLDGVPKTGGFFSLYLRYANDLHIAIANANGAASNPVILDVQGVSQLLPARSLDWIQRTNGLPIVSAGQRVELVGANELLARALYTPWTAKETVLMAPEVGAGPTNSTHVGISDLVYKPGKITFSTMSTTACVAVVSESWHRNWVATIDGTNIALLRANHAFQGLLLPAGHRKIALTYSDRAFTFGAALSLVALTFWGILSRRKEKARA